MTTTSSSGIPTPPPKHFKMISACNPLKRLCRMNDIHESSPSSFQDVSPASSESVHAKFGINDDSNSANKELHSLANSFATKRRRVIKKR
ncbi:hypothetical protein IC582_021289 [Cucumis melo]